MSKIPFIPAENLEFHVNTTTVQWESMTLNAIPREPVEMTVSGTLPIVGWCAGYPITQEMLQQLKWHDEYARKGKRYPRPRRQRSKARMARKWREWKP